MDRPTPVVTTLIVGDVHAQPYWWKKGVLPRAMQIGASKIIGIGDFGWTWTEGFRHTILQGIANTGIAVDWFDGNHEDFDFLETIGIFDGEGPQKMFDEPLLRYLPRGTVLDVEGISTLAIGGGVSVDKAHRTEYESWWSQETITADQAMKALQAAQDAGSNIELMLTHDTVAGYHIPGTHSGWKQEFADSEAHRRALGHIVEQVQPRLLIHGHYHHTYRTQVNGLYIQGLGCDGDPSGMLTFDRKYWDNMLAGHFLEDA